MNEIFPTSRRKFIQMAGATAAATVVGKTLRPNLVMAQIPKYKADKIDNKLYYLTVEGTPYERGYAHGQALRFVIRGGINRWKQWIAEVLEESNPEIEIAEFVHGTNFFEAIQQHTPDLYLELQGIAQGAGVDFNTLYAYNMFDEFVAFTIKKYRLGFCTGLGVYGRRNLANIIGQNDDLPVYFDRTQTLLRVKHEDGLETFVYTFAGVLANGGVNTANLGCTINILPTRKGDNSGLPMPYLVRGILERRSRQEALDFVKAVGSYAAPMNYIIGDPSGVTMIETAQDLLVTYDKYEGETFVAHTNHPLEDTNKLEPGIVSKSPERLAKTIELMSGRVKEIGVSEVKQIFRTPPILKSYQTDPTFPTLLSVIIELAPDNPKIYVAPGPPDIHNFSSFDFEKGFLNTASEV